VESAAALLVEAERIAASMGPRHLSRGILMPKGSDTANSIASMGPRHLSRGIILVQGKLALGDWGFNGATASEPWNHWSALLGTARPSALQWGHGI